ncbi:D-alanine--D-alanine ligase family protein [Demequina sp. NBRC 110055]|uniref:D-alanine--D-alanine ligase family protein n=1 Tax=Demequina sp. NBRC 110055 TaxID=1570344 RepID=UPI000A019773|nr:D-alanine--D-alanine ligase family protein [Demequina sp. NBRC 110055]
MARATVAVVFGGRSSEHGVSCVTAGGVLGAIDRDRYDVVAIGITREGRWVPAPTDPADWAIIDGEMPEVRDAADTVLAPTRAGERAWSVLDGDGTVSPLAEIDVVFPVLHGPYGEDGTVQGALELVDVRYVGSGVLASAAGMDKQFMKTAFRAAGLPVTPDVTLLRGDRVADRIADVEALGLPVFVKPARAGSSMGISKVSDLATLEAAVADAAKHDPKVLIEQAVSGREIETAVLETVDGPRASVPGEIITGGGHDFYDFEAKYLDEGAVNLVSTADLPPELERRVRDTAIAAFRAVGAEGLARVDVFVTDAGDIVINEINTMPGFTPTSMYPRMWAAAGIEYPELVQTLIETALARPVGLR